MMIYITCLLKMYWIWNWKTLFIHCTWPITRNPLTFVAENMRWIRIFVVSILMTIWWWWWWRRNGWYWPTRRSWGGMLNCWHARWGWHSANWSKWSRSTQDPCKKSSIRPSAKTTNSTHQIKSSFYSISLYMSHSQMLGKFKYGLPAKFWRLASPHFGKIWRPNCWHQVNFWGTPEKFGV